MSGTASLPTRKAEPRLRQILVMIASADLGLYLGLVLKVSGRPGSQSSGYRSINERLA